MNLTLFRNLIAALIFLLLLIGTYSCKLALRTVGLKNPKVETSGSILRFLVRNDFDTANVYLLKGDSATAMEKVYWGMEGSFLYFDNNGKQLAFKGETECPAITSASFFNDLQNSFVPVDTLPNLQSILNEISNMDGDAVSFDEISGADYYIVNYWQIFMGGRRNYGDDERMLSQRFDTLQNINVSILRINADLQNSWGLKEGKKAKLKLRKEERGYYEILISDLPYSK
jgi:hypothetical protein